MNIYQQLQEVGLSKSEIAIYLYLLQNGMSSTPRIARGVNIARANCYHVLRLLKERNLIREEKKGQRSVYSARNPRALFFSLNKKREIVERLLPDLQALLADQINKPAIRFYEGFLEVKELYMEIARAEKVYAFGSTKQLSSLDPTFYVKLMKEFKRRGVILDDINTVASLDMGFETRDILGPLYTVKYLSSKYSDISTDMLIWGDSVALITLREPIFGTVLTNPFLMRTFRVCFEVMWEKLSEK